jgi:hypothetical protein
MDADLVAGLADLSSGELLGDETVPSLEAFASAAPELFADSALLDIVLVSPDRVHVAQRVPDEARLAHLSVARRTRSVGLILSEARARMGRL